MKKLFAAIGLVALLSMSLLAQAQSKKDKAAIKELDNYFETALTDWQVPGIAIGIVRGNEVLLAKGYGVKQVNGTEKVDANTLFPVASNTKAFTAAAIGILVDRGLMSWDDKVKKHLPWFELYDVYVSNAMTIRDLLSHRSGLKTFAGDLVWYGTQYGAEEIVRRARHLEPTHGFREHYGYSNIMYIAAGLVIEKVSGKSYNEFIQENILDPLQMTTTLTSVDQITAQLNITSLHTDYKDSIVKVQYLNWDNMAPAGALISNVNEMNNWLKCQLNSGDFNGKQLVSKKAIHQMRTVHVSKEVSEGYKKRFPSTHFRAYGLGWGLMDYHGKFIVSHSGGYDGAISYTCIVPEADLAFVILTNKNSSLYYPLIYKILDRFLSNETTDWSSLLRNRSRKPLTSGETTETVSGPPSLKLSEYAGKYKSDLYGTIEVIENDGQLYLEMIPTPLFKGRTKHLYHNTWELELYMVPSLPKGTMHFVLNAAGKVEELKIDVPNPDFDFTELKFFKQ